MRIPELDGVRALAILLVIGCHYEAFARHLGGLPKFGWIGVDLFFVLSGYLITGVLLNLKGQSDAFRVFYVRRFLRILPPYFAALVLIYSSCYFFDPSAITLRGAVKHLLFLQSFGHVSAMLHPVSGNAMSETLRGLTGNIGSSFSVLWSLSIEEYFYVLWAPLVLWFSRKTVLRVGIAICVVEFLIRWFAFIGYQTYFSIYHRFDSLIFGAFIALAGKRIVRYAVPALITGIVVLTSVIAYLWPVMNYEIRDAHLFAVFGIPAISLIAAGTVGLLIANTGKLWFAPLRSLRPIGTISYMLYLVHGFVYLLALRWFAPTWTMTLSCLTASLLLCAASWRWMEAPIFRMRDAFLNRSHHAGRSNSTSGGIADMDLACVGSADIGRP